jgi:hypothetical protein
MLNVFTVARDAFYTMDRAGEFPWAQSDASGFDIPIPEGRLDEVTHRLAFRSCRVRLK